MTKGKCFITALLCFALLANVCLPAFAADELQETGNREESFVFDNGAARLYETDDCVVLTIDTFGSERSTYSLSAGADSSETENHVRISTAYVPDSKRAHDAIYHELSNKLSQTGRSIETGSSSITGRDSSYCASFTLTINYTREVQNGRAYYDIISVEGGFSDTGTTSGAYVGENVYVHGLSLDVYQKGITAAGAINTSQVAENLGQPVNDDRTWYQSVPGSWVPVRSGGIVFTVGATYYFTLKRGGAYWTSEVDLYL